MTDLLSPMEAIMWRVGQDATLRMTVGALVILESAADHRSAHRTPRVRGGPCAAVAPTTRRADGAAPASGMGR